MFSIVCLIANPTVARLDDATVERARRALPETELFWLAPGEALELGPVELSSATAQELVRQAVDSAPVDVVAVAAEGRKKKLLLCDMDSTMIEVECVDELADAAGIKERIAAITRRAMNGEIPFESALAERVALLKGLPEAELSRVRDERIPLTPGGGTLVRTMRANGATTALISGGFTHFTAHVAALLGFDTHRANELEIEAGRLTGNVVEPILGQDSKVQTMAALMAEHDLEARDVLAVGDGANDVPMLERAGLGVAFRAHRRVRAAIRARLDQADLRAVLYLQGYHRDEFVTA